MFYSVSLQFINNSYCDMFEKSNYIITNLMFFVCVTYVFTFYPFIYYLDNKKSSTNLLVQCKYNHNSFWYEPCLFISRSALKSFFHGFFITNYQTQIIVLFLLDIPYLFLVIKMRKYFRYTIFFIIMLLYLIGFAFFNFYFVL